MLKEIVSLLNWLKVKLFLRARQKSIPFKEREIWWCNVGMNVGTEIYGKGDKFARPVLILKKFSAQGFFGVPLTSQTKKGEWYAPITCEGVDGSVILNQARSFDAKRLMRCIEFLDDESFQRIMQSFLDFMNPHKNLPRPEGAGTLGHKDPEDMISS